MGAMQPSFFSGVTNDGWSLFLEQECFNCSFVGVIWMPPKVIFILA
jgi:hypothetical protein